MTKPYRGRFAPSPTGPLHSGSLMAATASYLEARHQGGQWLVRIEDIDPPREVPGAADAILASLTAFGFEWDTEVTYQSQRSAVYHAALDQLQRDGHLFACACSRKEIQHHTPKGVYPGTCRSGLPAGRHARSWRVRTDQRLVSFHDRIQGPIAVRLDQQVGDYVLKRADGLFAYQLAVAVDDADQGITDVVRGADLLASTPQQIYLHHLLDLTSPDYAHHPVLLDRHGEKFSKRHQARALDNNNPVPQLWQVLDLLGQAPDDSLQHAPLNQFWDQAIANWRIGRVPARSGLRIEELPNPVDK